jgi:hypothetical protein
MTDSSDWCTNVVEDLKKRRQLPEVTLDLLKINNREKLTAVESILVIRALLREFEVDNELIIPACEEASRKDSIEWALCSHIANLYDEDDHEFSSSIISNFNHILKNTKGFWTDWKYGDDTVQWWMNHDRLLPKYGLKISFSQHTWDEPFEIALLDRKTGAILEKATFRYSQKYHDMHELIGQINKTITSRGLEFVDADEGADSFVFILFDSALLDRLNKKYGDVGRLINWNRRIDNGRVN